MLKQDVENLKNIDPLNHVIKGLIDDYYNFNIPKLNFNAHSIIVVASMSKKVIVNFNVNRVKIPLTLPPSYIDMNSKPKEIEEYANNFLNKLGRHVKLVYKLPFKMLAVRSGLSIYGKNNICYRDDMGSFFKITVMYSDIECENSHWHDFKQMDSCKNCTLCINSCPTNAISKENNIIKANLCLTHFNENDGEFPSFIKEEDHNSIVGCLRCQECCPHNIKFLNDVIEPVEFTENETRLLLDGESFKNLPENLLEKLKVLNLIEDENVLSRNLNALIK